MVVGGLRLGPEYPAEACSLRLRYATPLWLAQGAPQPETRTPMPPSDAVNQPTGLLDTVRLTYDTRLHRFSTSQS